MPKPAASYGLFRESSDSFATLATVLKVPVPTTLTDAIPVFTDPEEAAQICDDHNQKCIDLDKCVVASFPIPMEGSDVDGKTIDVRCCARCGGDHDRLIFFKLNNPPDDFSYWAPCPNKGQPILMAIRPTAPNESKEEKLAKFKDYVHKRLDEAGVPHEISDSPHTKEGCRIGGRLDYVLNLAGLGMSRTPMPGERATNILTGKPESLGLDGTIGPWEPRVNEDVLYGEKREPARIVRIEGDQYVLRCPGRSSSPIGATRDQIFPMTGEGLAGATRRTNK